MSRPQGPERRDAGRAGFSLIEALAALTVVAAGLGAMAQLTYTTQRNVAFAEHRLDLISAARKAYTALPPRTLAAASGSSGALGGERWRLSSGPYFAPGLPSFAAGWAPERIALEIRGPFGDRLAIDAAQLQRRGAQ